MIFSLLMDLRICELKDEAFTVKMNMMYLGVDTISALLMRRQAKARNRCAKYPSFFHVQIVSSQGSLMPRG